MLLMHDEYQKHTEGFMDVGWLLNDSSRDTTAGKGCSALTSRDVDKHEFKDRKWWWEQRLEDVGQTEAGLLRTKCYLSEGWSLKEGRKGHESLQQSGREDGQVTYERTKERRPVGGNPPPHHVGSSCTFSIFQKWSHTSEFHLYRSIAK